MKIGIKFASAKQDGPMNAYRLAELFCVETGETIEGVHDIDVHYGVNEVLSATVVLYPSEIRGTAERLYTKYAVPKRQPGIEHDDITKF